MQKYQNAIRYGIYSGLAIIAYHLLFLFTTKNVLVSTWFFYSIYLFHLGFMVASGLSFRRSREDLADFREILQEAFITFLVGMLMYYACYYLIFSMDEGVIALQRAKAEEQLAWFEQQHFFDKDQIAAWREGLENDDLAVDLTDLLRGLPLRIVGGFVLSALVGVMVKR